MAVVNLPPGEAMAMAREADLRRRLNSPDPTVRYRAREESELMSMRQMSRIAAAQAKATERAYFQELERCERSNRKNNKYRSLPAGARVLKGE